MWEAMPLVPGSLKKVPRGDQKAERFSATVWQQPRDAPSEAGAHFKGFGNVESLLRKSGI